MAKSRRTEQKKTRNRIVQSKRADKKELQRLNKKERWAKDEKYQEEQKKRLEDLKKHRKYEFNIAEGKRQKEYAKKQKQDKLRRKKELLKRRLSK